MEQFTRDHVAKIAEDRAYLARALGIDLHLDVNFIRREIKEMDVFIFTTDYVHYWVSREEIVAIFTAGTKGSSK